MKTEAEATQMRDRVLQLARRVDSFSDPRLKTVAETLASILGTFEFVLDGDNILGRIVDDLEKEFGKIGNLTDPSRN